LTSLKPGNKLTYVDIARMVGVGASTVSRVLNQSTRVAPDTREKILNAIKTTGYKPSSAARMLVRRQHETIGLIFEKEHIKTYYGACLIEGVSEILAETGQRLAMAMVKWHSRAEDIESLPLLRTVSVDGLIFDIHHIEGNLDGVVARLGLPYVYINPSGACPYNAIIPDDVSVARDATQYLIDRGHRKIAYLPCPGTSTHSSQADRMKGYAEVMIRAGLPPVPLWDVPLEKVDNPVQDYLNRAKYYKEQCGCTAMVAYNSVEAGRVIQACYQQGYKVPREMSVVVCDYDPVMQVLLLDVTCFRFDRTHMGQLAVQMLDQRMKNDGQDIPSMVLKGSLMEGETVIPVRSTV
jgi:LacI family transcriptional regulator